MLLYFSELKPYHLKCKYFKANNKYYTHLFHSRTYKFEMRKIKLLFFFVLFTYYRISHKIKTF